MSKELAELIKLAKHYTIGERRIPSTAHVHICLRLAAMKPNKKAKA